VRAAGESAADDYNARVDAPRSGGRTFSLQDAQQLLPEVKRLTEEAVQQADRVAAEIDTLQDSDPERALLTEQLNTVVGDWADRVRALGVDVKGLWLVDFDTGDGYYCWKYPEPAVTHYHTYEDGFAGRMKIT
jgi:hypothetical protein